MQSVSLGFLSPRITGPSHHAQAIAFVSYLSLCNHSSVILGEAANAISFLYDWSGH